MKMKIAIAVLLLCGFAVAANPHVIPAAATIHVGDTVQFYFPLSSSNATETWQVSESNSAIGAIDQTGKFTTDTLPGSVLVRVQSSDYPGVWFYAVLTVMP